MNYTVVWKPEAENQLADLWMSAADRAAVTKASHQIDQSLARDPSNEGESRVGDARILFIPPLAVLFTVDEPNRTVTVGSVGPSRRSS